MNDVATERSPTRPPTRAPVLVVGVGSELRCDDAAGRRVADIVAELHLPGVEVRSVHQLTPELATVFARRQLVVVVDASVDVDRLTVNEIATAAAVGSFSHHLDVGSVVALSHLFPDPPRRVVTVGIPAHDLSLGTRLSSATESQLLAAVSAVTELCDAVHDDGAPN